MFEKPCHSNLCQVGKAVELKKVLDFAVHPPNVLVETFFWTRQGGLFQDLAVHINIYICNYDESGTAGPGDHPAKGLKWSAGSF